MLLHGVGGINVDGCRVGTDSTVRPMGKKNTERSTYGKFSHDNAVSMIGGSDAGRWPANLIHDGSEEVVELFPDSNGSGPARKLNRGIRQDGDGYGMADKSGDLRDAGKGSAARFFYCAKASRKDRHDDNNHPTVKPTDLMRYLCRLVTPPGGLVLDPFAGSGSTGKAAMLEGFRFVGIEQDADYLEIARKRLDVVAKRHDDIC